LRPFFSPKKEEVTMSLIAKLRERRTALAVEANRLLDTHKGADFNKEINKQYDQLTDEIESIDDRIDLEQAKIDAMADSEFDDIINQSRKGKKQNSNDPMVNIFDKWVRRGEPGLTAEETQKIYATMSTTTGSEGGYSVPSLIAKNLVESLKEFGGIRSIAQVITTSTGNPLSYPTTDGTAETGELIAENATATDADIVFGTVSLSVYKYSSKIVAVPIELLVDSEIDIEDLVNRRLAERIARITNTHYTTGTGTAQPRGVMTGATLGKTGTTGQTLTVIHDDLVDLVESVDEAYQRSGNCKFMFNQATRKVIRKLKDDANRPIWTPGYDENILGGAPDRLLGFPVVISNDVAVPAASARSIAFGDFTKYIIRDTLQVQMMRFTDSAYAKLGQVGFLAFMRSGGNLTDTAAVKYYANSAT
jgi:HK97 family phage major capsid protein